MFGGHVYQACSKKLLHFSQINTGDHTGIHATIRNPYLSVAFGVSSQRGNQKINTPPE